MLWQQILEQRSDHLWLSVTALSSHTRLELVVATPVNRKSTMHQARLQKDR